MLRLILLLTAISLCATQKPFFEVETRQRTFPKGIELTHILINNSGRPVKGVEIRWAGPGPNLFGQINVTEFPKGTNLKAKRITIPGGSFQSHNIEGEYPTTKASILSVTFADGSQWLPAPK